MELLDLISIITFFGAVLWLVRAFRVAVGLLIAGHVSALGLSCYRALDGLNVGDSVIVAGVAELLLTACLLHWRSRGFSEVKISDDVGPLVP